MNNCSHQLAVTKDAGLLPIRPSTARLHTYSDRPQQGQLEVGVRPRANPQSRFGNGLAGMPPAGIEPAHAV